MPHNDGVIASSTFFGAIRVDMKNRSHFIKAPMEDEGRFGGD